MCHDKRQRSDEIIARYANGSRTMKAVAAYFGVSQQRVNYVLKQAGVRSPKALRSRKELKPAQYRRFRNLCNNGIPAAIAHEEVRR